MNRRVLLASALMTVLAPPAFAEERLGFSRDGRPTVALRVNERPVTMILDTGAAHTTLSPDAAARLGIQNGEATTVAGVNGERQANRVRLARVDGVISRQDMRALVLDSDIYAEADGLLGMDQFSRDVLTIDFEARSFTLSAATGPERIFSAERMFRHLLAVDGLANGRPVKVFFDSGSQQTIINQAAVDLLELTPRPYPGVADIAGISIADTGFVVVRVLELPGPLYLGGVSAFVASTPSADAPAILIGAPAMAMFGRMTFDYARDEIRIPARF